MFYSRCCVFYYIYTMITKQQKKSLSIEFSELYQDLRLRYKNFLNPLDATIKAHQICSDYIISKYKLIDSDIESVNIIEKSRKNDR